MCSEAGIYVEYNGHLEKFGSEKLSDLAAYIWGRNNRRMSIYVVTETEEGYEQHSIQMSADIAKLMQRIQAVLK